MIHDVTVPEEIWNSNLLLQLLSRTHLPKFKIKKIIAKILFSKLYSWSLDYFARVANALENHANARARVSVCWSSVRDAIHVPNKFS